MNHGIRRWRLVLSLLFALTPGNFLVNSPVALAALPTGRTHDGTVDIENAGVLFSQWGPVPSPPAAGERGRPRIANGTVVSDVGSRIRGASYVAHYNCSGGDPATWSTAPLADWGPTYGLNAVRVFLAPKTETCAGGADAAPLIDQLVLDTAKYGLYMILVPGGDGDGSALESELKAFWSFYAPRYRDHTHVIYEIKNEPEYAPGYAPDVIQMEIDLWNIIRWNAPYSMILAWSPGAFIGYESALLRDLRRGAGIDYSNTAVAVHDYCYRDAVRSCVDDMERAVSSVRSQGFSLISTEFYSCDSGPGMNDYIAHFENLGMAWTVFRFPENSDGNDCSINSTFKSEIGSAGITWPPDYGSWPQHR